MRYNKLSKDELVSKITKLESDLIESNSIIKELETAKDTDNQQSSILKFINSMAIPSADKSTVDEFTKVLLKAVKDYTGADVATFSLYLPNKKELQLLHIEAEQGVLKTVVKIAGDKIAKTASPVDDETYNLIIKAIVGKCDTFTEVTFGAIPKLVDKAIRITTGIDRFYPIAHVIEGKLYGTTMLAFKKGQTSPSIELLESYAHLMSVSLRRYNTENALEDSEIKHRTYIEHAPLGIIIANNKGKYIDANPGAAELLGYTKNELLKLSIPDILVNTQDIESFQKLKEKGKLSNEIKLKKKDGTTISVRIDAVLLPNNQFIAFHTDITERKKAEDALKESEEKFKETTNLMPQIIFESDLNGNLTYVNENAFTLLGYPKDYSILYKSPLDFFTPESKQKARENISRKLNGNQKNVTYQYELVRKDGSTFPVLIYSTPINKEGKSIGLRGLIVDISEPKKIELELIKAKELVEKSELRFKAISEQAMDGIVLTDLEGRYIFVNHAFCKMMGYSRGELLKLKVFDLRDDNSENTLFNRIKEDQIKGKSTRTKLIRKDKSIIYVDINGSFLNLGEEQYILGIHRNVTELVNRENELIEAKEKAEESEEKINRLIESTIDFIWTVDPVNFGIQTYNSALYNYFLNNAGIKMKIGDTPDILVSSRAEEWKNYYQKVLETGPFEFEYQVVANESALYLSFNTLTRNNKVFGISVFGRDITRLKKNEFELIKAKEKAEENEEKFKLLNRLTSEMLLLQDIESIYKFIAENLQKHYPNTIILNSSINESNQQSRLEIISGLNNSLLNKAIKTLGFNPIGRTYKLTESHYNYFKSGDFIEFDGGLAKFSASELHAFTATAIEKLIGLHKIYIIGINKDDGLLATIYFFTFNEQAISDGNFIEAFVRQAGLVIQKKIDEKALKIAKEKEEESKKRFKFLLENAPDAVAINDIEGRLIYASPNAFRHFGYSENEIIGHFGHEFSHPDDLDIVYKAFDTIVSNPAQKVTAKYRFRKRDGEYRWIETTFTNLLNNEIIKGFVLNFNDITEKKQALEELVITKEKAEESERKLIVAQELSHVGSWEYIIDTDTVSWSKELYNIFERPHDLPAPKYSEQRPYYTDESFALMDKAVQDCVQREVPYEIELDIYTSTGSKKHIISKGNVKKDENNKIIGSFGTAQDITTQKKLKLELVKEKEKAEESDRLKSAFLANMSHEIRTPMNGILGFAELLKEPKLTGEQQKKYIDIIKKSGDRMLNIINDIIDISKIESGQMKFVTKDSNINKQLEYIYTFFKPELETKGIQLVIKNSLPETKAIVQTDREKVFAILTNLVKNAIKFTDQGSIELGCKLNGEFIEFFVKDSGVGIPKNRQIAIFERFIQADIEDSRAFQGAGLGLAITKSYVEMLGGKIWVESEEGIGSTFYFTIPHNIKHSEETNVQNIVLTDLEKEQNRDLKILIAEDDDNSKLLISELVNSYSKEILFANDGFEAIEACKNNPDIDLILMDIKMPKINGYEATKEIRKFNKDVIIISQTAFGLAKDREKALESGCNDYISKPIKQDLIISLLEKYFS